MTPDEQSRIEELKKSLYSRSAPDIRTKRRLRFTRQEMDMNTDWEHKEERPREEVKLNTQYKDNSMSFFTKLFIGSIIFFLMALGIGSYLLLNGSNIVSANNIDITVNGPVSVSGGEPVSFDIQVSNKNNIKLETVDLSVDFPSGTTDSEDTTKELKIFRELISDIEPGGIGQRTVKVVVYGEENSKKEIKVRVEYRIKGSNAIFQKEKIFDLLISSSPLTLLTNSFKEVNSGQEFELTVNIASNSKEIIKNLLLKAVYPFGFTFISSDTKPFSDNTVWKIGDIPPGGKKTIKIKGKLDGQDDETRIFRFITGAQSVRNEKVIGTEYVSSTQEIAIKKPFVSIGLSIEGNSDNQEYIGKFNNPIKVEVLYFNNLQTSVIDGEIHVKLSGTALDKLSVSPDQGVYNSLTNEIVWNQITNKELANISTGEGGRVSFNIIPRDLSTVEKSITNPDISINVNVQGKRNSETDVPESITSSANRHIKISSNLSLSGQVIRSTGPFENTGFIPPKSEQPTTYTIVWTVDNTSSTVTDAEVHSSLPPYVKWTGKISPSGENISYNSVDGQIVWRIGNVDTYTFNSSHRRQVAFQVSLTPSITQVGQIPVLVNQSSLTAQDDFTLQTLNSFLGQLNTRFSTDQMFRDGDEKVIQ